MTKKQINQIRKILRANIDGRKNAKPIRQIVNTLVRNGVITSHRHFQLILKPALLEAGLALGACNDGMFLCHWSRDYREATQWYSRRLVAEGKRMSQILTLGMARCSREVV